jgi:hypothetical protein
MNGVVSTSWLTGSRPTSFLRYALADEGPKQRTGLVGVEVVEQPSQEMRPLIRIETRGQ